MIGDEGTGGKGLVFVYDIPHTERNEGEENDI